MRILLIDNGSTLINKLQSLLPSHTDVVRFDVLQQTNPQNFDVTILSGGSMYPVVGNEDKFSDEISFIQTTTKPLVGICLGCELIIKSFGGDLMRMDNPHRGIREIQMKTTELIPKLSIKVYEHHDWIISKIPNTFDVLAGSPDGPEIIKHHLLPIYGFQFHPEKFVDTTEEDELFLTLLSRF